MADALVIGYGNDLRSDDGAGRWVAQQIDDRGLDGIEVRSVAQLTPELALEIAGRSVVVFVDASVDVRELTIDEVEASSEASTVMTHHGNPADLLSRGGGCAADHRPRDEASRRLVGCRRA